jgi:NADH-quinone oxidoreductase subunit D
VLRVLLAELTRLASHLMFIGAMALDLGASSPFLYCWREREKILDFFERMSGARMMTSFIRPGGLVRDLDADLLADMSTFVDSMPAYIDSYEDLLTGNPIWRQRNVGIGHVGADDLLALGVTGPVLRAAGVAHDLRKSQPYSGYETYEFDVPTRTESDCFARYEVRVAEMYESLKIIDQCMDRLDPGPVMVEDPKVAWPARLEVGPDGIGNSEAYVKHIMEESMEALIHHFKMVTQGFQVPAGEVYQTVESPRGELGMYVVSNGGQRPYRCHIRGPSFVNLQAVPAMVEGGLVADVVAAVASLDPVMGDADR